MVIPLHCLGGIEAASAERSARAELGPSPAPVSSRTAGVWLDRPTDLTSPTQSGFEDPPAYAVRPPPK